MGVPPPTRGAHTLVVLITGQYCQSYHGHGHRVGRERGLKNHDIVILTGTWHSSGPRAHLQLELPQREDIISLRSHNMLVVDCHFPGHATQIVGTQKCCSRTEDQGSPLGVFRMALYGKAANGVSGTPLVSLFLLVWERMGLEEYSVYLTAQNA